MNFIPTTQRQDPFANSTSAACGSTLIDLLDLQRKDYYNLSVASSSVNGGKARKELEELVDECSEKNWDGYESLPVNMLSAIRAERLLELLPDHINEPEVSLDGDGQVIFEWFTRSRATSLLVKPEEQIIFSDIDGKKRIRGRVHFDSWLNSSLRHIIESL